MQLRVELSQEQLRIIVRRAVMAGFMRVNPGKTWTQNEQREAARWYIRELANGGTAMSMSNVRNQNAKDPELNRN